MNTKGIRLYCDNINDPHEVMIKFGPHYYVKIDTTGGKTEFRIGATHHGITADASVVDSELEKVINKMREVFPHLKHD